MLLNILLRLYFVGKLSIMRLYDRDNEKHVIVAMKQAHPYEEVAFDIYPLLSEEEL